MFKYDIVSIGEILFDVFPTYIRLGGAPFNFIYHVNRLTGGGDFISAVGEDVPGVQITSYLEKNSFPLDFIRTDDRHKTGEVRVTLDENKIPSFIILENRAYDYIEYSKQLRTLVKDSDLFYFGTLAQRGKVSRDTIQRLLKHSKKSFCDLNLRQKFYSPEILDQSLQASNIIKINVKELSVVNELLIEKPFSVDDTPKYIIDKYNIDLVCLTQGAKGARLFTADEENHYQAKPIKIKDTVGAGDAFSAIIAIGTLLEMPLDKLNKFANDFATKICAEEGAIPEGTDLYAEYRAKIFR